MTHNALLRLLSSVEGWLSSREALLLYELAKRIPAPGEIVEIGSYKGRSTIALSLGIAESSHAGFVWAIDPHEGVIHASQRPSEKGTLEEFEENIKKAGAANRIKTWVTISEKAAKRWKYPIRLIFFDGLHDYQNTASDYAFWSPHIMTFGVMAFHDGFCGEEGVWKAVSLHCLTRKDVVDIGTVGSILYVIIGWPTIASRFRVLVKKCVVYWSRFFYLLPLPKIVKILIIHKFFRLFLLTPYTLAVYKETVRSPK